MDGWMDTQEERHCFEELIDFLNINTCDHCTVFTLNAHVSIPCLPCSQSTMLSLASKCQNIFRINVICLRYLGIDQRGPSLKPCH